MGVTRPVMGLSAPDSQFIIVTAYVSLSDIPLRSWHGNSVGCSRARELPYRDGSYLPRNQLLGAPRRTKSTFGMT